MESAIVLQQAPQAGTGQCPHGPIRERGIYLAKSGITRFSIRVVHTSGRPLMKALLWRCSAALMTLPRVRRVAERKTWAQTS